MGWGTLLMPARHATVTPTVRCLRRSLLIGRFHLRDRGGHDGSRPPVHSSNERDRRDSVRHARVRQPWKTGPQHRGLWLVCDEVGPTTAVPMHSVQGHAEHEHGDCLQRASLHATGVRPSGKPARRRREDFCDRPRHGPFPQHHRALARAGLDGREALQRRDVARLRPH